MVKDDHKNNKPDIEYASKIMSVLSELRKNAFNVENNYLDRLGHFVTSKTVDESASFLSILLRTVKKKFLMISHFCKILSLAPTLIHQVLKLHNIKKNTSSRNILAIGLASNRLNLRHPSLSGRSYLKQLVKTLGNSSNDDLESKVNSSDLILIFDPLAPSNFWSKKTKFWQDNVLIVDMPFLIVFFIAGIFVHFFKTTSMLFRLMKNCYTKLKRDSRLTLNTYVQTCFYSLLFYIFSDIFAGFSKINAFFLNSNSRLVELLRSFLIQDNNCEKVYEIMHGIGSKPVESYFAKVLELGRSYSAYDKHFFIPQIPNLPLFGVFETQADFDSSVAINSYLNQWYMDNLMDVSNIDDFVQMELKKIHSELSMTSKPIVVTIYGNCPYGDKIETSTLFLVECLFIDLLGKYNSKLGDDCLIIYVPHPAYKAEKIDSDVFVKNNVKIYRNSVFSWLISDLSISLVSSAIFEAAYFGSIGFTPNLLSDNYYTQGYLDLLHYPKSDKYADVLAEFENFINRSCEIMTQSMIAKARSRYKLMQNSKQEIPNSVQCEDEMLFNL